MPAKEEIILRILQARPDLTREIIEESIGKKKKDAGKLLTDEGAAYMVANDLGIDLSSERVLRTRMTIRDLAVGASDVTMDGTVMTVNQVRDFRRNDGREGKVARIVIADETGMVNVVLWDDKAEIAEHKLTKGDVVRVNHGYVRAGLDGKPELNVGQRGSVVILPPNLRADASYAFKEVDKKIRDIGEGDSYVNLIAFVKEVPPASIFRRSDGREGKVVRARLADETGRIVAVFWDEKTELIQKARGDDCVKIVNGQVRRGLAGALEIHVGKESDMIVLREKPKGVSSPSPAITKIGKLTPGMSDVDILARVTSVGQIKEFARPSGDKGKVGEIFLMDETGSVRLSLWDEKTEMLNDVSPSDVVLVEGAYTRESSGGVSLNLGKMGALRLNPDIEEAEHLPSNPTGLAKIGELKAGFSASIEGKISEEPRVKTVSTRDGREIKVASLRIKDSSGEIRAAFWGDLADKFESIPLGTEITVRNAYVKNGFAGELELSSRSATEVETSEVSRKSSTTSDRSKQETLQKIAELKEGERTRVQGKIVDITRSRVYMACPRCRSKVNEEDGEWRCRKCGVVSQPAPRLLMNILLEDDSGSIAAIVGGDLAEKLLGMKAEYAWNVATQSGDSSTPVDIVKKRIINRSITLTGRVKTDNFGELGFTVDSIE